MPARTCDSHPHAFEDLTDRITFNPDTATFIGSGGSSDIYKTTFNGKDVAIKVFRDILVRREEKRRLLARRINAETKAWSIMKHKNILPFLGVFFFRGGHGLAGSSITMFSLVSPWMKNGTVTEYLRHQSTKNRPQVRIELLTDIANGLTYLHSHGIVHGDIKGCNILVSDDGAALLADFGLAKRTETNSTSMNDADTSTNNGPRGTIRWMAPELACAESASNPTRESDIWSFGCVVLELIASVLPYEKRRNPFNVIHAMMHHEPPAKCEKSKPDENALGIASGIPISFHKYPTLWALCQSCWNFNPAIRPNCKVILESLHEAAEFTNSLLRGLNTGAPLTDSVQLNGGRIDSSLPFDPCRPFQDFSFHFDPSTHPLFQGATISTSPFEDFALSFDHSTLFEMPEELSESHNTRDLRATPSEPLHDFDAFAFCPTPQPRAIWAQ
ncbi:kinase-like protein [Sistotremastrum niveocremeum HHB9708]|uniref:Kinase-like protein n=1 Tax=Sistotremastrum niveocremeum HHB9708 TaxID=1314777 RepID=A0A164WVX0_9AGAM|nr:kinase-like protein [Sistotremastrum niveocremeum HHB9708]